MHKLLGLHYDAPLLCWKAHVDYLRVECAKRIDLMKTISSIKWGASSKILRSFYVSYIRSKLDYGAMIYCTAAATNLKKLDIIQNTCCRLILGARKSTPIQSLQAEAHIPSLELHRGHLMVKTLIKLSYEPNNSVVDNFLIGSGMYLDNNFPVNSFMRRALHWSRIFGIDIKRCNSKLGCGPPPWKNDNYVVNEFGENIFCTNEVFLKYVNEKYPKFHMCFTDGSKVRGSASAVGSAIYFPKQRKGSSFRLHPNHSVIFSELFAIGKALDIIEQISIKNFVIFTDSASALQLIAGSSNSYHTIVSSIKMKLCKVNQNGKVLLHWVKGHVEIKGNNIADKLAKMAVKNDKSVYSPLTKEEMISCLHSSFLKYWDENWRVKCEVSGKGLALLKIRDSIMHILPIYKLKNRLYEKVIYRLRIGHVGLKSYLNRIGLADSAMCEHCRGQVEETVQHYLLECPAFSVQRQCMYAKLLKHKIGIVNLKVLLGGERIYQDQCIEILSILIQFISSTNRLSDM